MSLESCNGLIAELGQKLGLGDLTPDTDGYVGLEIDGLPIHFQHDAETDELVLFARLGEAPPDRLEEVYAELLAANLFWQGTKGATLAIEPTDDIVFIAERLALPLIDLARLEERLGGFVDIAEHWRDFLTRAARGEPLDDEAAVPGDAAPPFDGGLPPGGIILA